ncbi:S26 family signal peptidase [Inquilinus limosus]|uniref:S26 family signal peptidase n=1 Tax=Inquilinus limosus TaxID=171674 RepID=A0A211ZHF8_9PROT|nr:S26 family signal peptidase [Inquilinus limosus]OWJ64626.1 S26 family signal peptidase [Inquilinus limosus]
MKARIAMLILMLAGIGLIAVPALVSPIPRLVWNASASLPVGLYRVRAVDHLAVGDIVLARAPTALVPLFAERGYLPEGVPLLKRIAALPGRIVCRAGLQITVDGTFAGQVRERDRAGRMLPVWQGCRKLGSGQIFLMNRDVPDSLDGRYFGPVPTSSIIGQAEPFRTPEAPQ